MVVRGLEQEWCRKNKIVFWKIYDVSVLDTGWTSHVEVDGILKQFKLDTGAAVSVIGNQSINPNQLKPPDKILTGAGRIQLNTLGSTEKTLTCTGKSMKEKLCVVKGQTISLLGGPGCIELGPIAKIGEVRRESKVNDKPDFPKEFPQLFLGLGCLNEPYFQRRLVSMGRVGNA
ncbi:Pol polyprotein [Plakobranchus ocellatus]|uniref:Pol polyprotein n=1 Tax=Plakobranchus ocellatus TaxID=259542 RepID=A0AAV4D1J8_9GAST|nr:Pol polyprotein [Plakobranchus ocellatus]